MSSPSPAAIRGSTPTAVRCSSWGRITSRGTRPTCACAPISSARPSAIRSPACPARAPRWKTRFPIASSAMAPTIWSVSTSGRLISTSRAVRCFAGGLISPSRSNPHGPRPPRSRNCGRGSHPQADPLHLVRLHRARLRQARIHRRVKVALVPRVGDRAVSAAAAGAVPAVAVSAGAGPIAAGCNCR